MLRAFDSWVWWAGFKASGFNFDAFGRKFWGISGRLRLSGSRATLNLNPINPKLTTET